MRRHKRLRLLNFVLGLVVLAAMLVPGAAAAPPPPPPAAGDANAAAQALAALGYNSGEVSVIPKGAKEVPG